MYLGCMTNIKLSIHFWNDKGVIRKPIITLKFYLKTSVLRKSPKMFTVHEQNDGNQYIVIIVKQRHVYIFLHLLLNQALFFSIVTFIPKVKMWTFWEKIDLNLIDFQINFYSKFRGRK